MTTVRNPPPPHRPTPSTARSGQGHGLLLALALGATAAFAAGPALPAATQLAQVELPSVTTRPRPRPAPVRISPAPKAEAPPAWGGLSEGQRQALGPLAGTWPTLSEAHKRKWIALSQNYPAMPAPEQALLHSRMAEWAALSPQQRTQARFNFAETKKLQSGDKKAKWEAYQALPPEEKRKLAAGAKAAKPPVPATAAAVQPAPQKLAKTPRPKKADARQPRITVVPNQIDQSTLLPQPGALPVQP